MKGKGIVKKLIASIILMFMIIISCSQTISYAATIVMTKTRNNTEYKFNGETVWDLGDSSIKSSNGEFYCLNHGTPAYYSDSGYTKVNLSNFSSASDLESKTGVKLNKSVQFKATSHKYTDNTGNKSLKALNWLVTNMYIPGKNNATAKTYMKNNIKTYINKYCSDEIKTADLGLLSDDEMDVIQQIVIWQFVTNKNTSVYNKINNRSDIAKLINTTNTNKAKAGYALYSALVMTAIEYANGNYTGTMGLTKNSKFELTISNSARKINAVSGKTNTYKTGTMTLSKNNINSLIFSLACGNSKVTIKNWSIVNASTNKVIVSKANIEGKNINSLISNSLKFYIQIETAQELITENPDITFSWVYTYKPGLKSKEAVIYYQKSKQPILKINKVVNLKSGNSGKKLFKYDVPGEFDFALTKNIEAVYSYEARAKGYLSKSYSRLKSHNTWNKSGTTIKYMSDKTPVEVAPGDIVLYKMTIWNEGDFDGYVQNVQDFLPNYLEYVPEDDAPEEVKTYVKSANNTFGITISKGETKNSTTKINIAFSQTKKINKTDNNGTKIKSNNNLEFYVACKVNTNAPRNTTLMNIAAINIYGYIDENGKYKKCSTYGIDRDSVENNHDIETFKDYVGSINNFLNDTDNNFKKTDKGEWVDEDDEDFEIVTVKGFDMALRKFITKIENPDGTVQYFNREPTIDDDTIDAFEDGKTTAVYRHKKTPIKVKKGATVTYTFRIYNEGYIAGFVNSICDYLPEGLSLKTDSGINRYYRWTTGSDSKTIYSYFLSTDPERTGEFIPEYEIQPSNGVEGFEKLANGKTISDSNKFWIDVELECVVDENNSNLTRGTILTNMAEIHSYGYYIAGNKIDKSDQYEPKWIASTKIDRDSSQGTIKTDLQAELNKTSVTSSDYYTYQTNEKHNFNKDTIYYRIRR